MQSKEIPTEPLPVHDTMDSLLGVVNLALASIKTDTPNQITTMLMIYHNTLLHLLKEQGKLK
ncbi:hypothetical protein [Pseudomonas phage 98PfluR60PP]|uniref:Uncharacterized protein n=1 Tax=Pseudomonas phage 98PfluR60PP TaxID=2163965 RepID=A0A2S1PFT7_9CAUD|nr:hypothetical protein PP760_gp09 [Pseudomonas phage 98PfluR60PP]AWH15441.1 hypothetical protein [Pseudomonas phage 98PfluR60PP]